MTSPSRRLAVACSALALAAGGAGAALAADGQPSPGAGTQAGAAQRPAGARHVRPRVVFALLMKSADYLGFTPGQLRTALQTGKPLAQIAATTPGKSAAGLKQYLLDALKTRLDQAVSNKHLTAAQEQTILAGAPARLDLFLSHVFARA